MKIRSDFVSNSSSSSFMILLNNIESQKFIDSIFPVNESNSKIRNSPNCIVIDNKCPQDIQKFINIDDSIMYQQVCVEHNVIDKNSNYIFISADNFLELYDQLNDDLKLNIKNNVICIFKEDCIDNTSGIDKKLFSEDFRKYLNNHNIKYTTSSVFI